MSVLTRDLNLKIQDLGADTDLKQKIHHYYDVFVNYLNQNGVASFVHSGYYI